MKSIKKLENSILKQNLGVTKFSDHHIININVPANADRVSLSDRLVNTITDSDYNNYKQKIVIKGISKKKTSVTNNNNITVKMQPN